MEKTTNKIDLNLTEQKEKIKMMYLLRLNALQALDILVQLYNNEDDTFHYCPGGNIIVTTSVMEALGYYGISFEPISGFRRIQVSISDTDKFNTLDVPEACRILKGIMTREKYYHSLVWCNGIFIKKLGLTEENGFTIGFVNG